MTDPRLPILPQIERKALWLSTWMIHNANHLRDNPDGMKVSVGTNRPLRRWRAS